MKNDACFHITGSQPAEYVFQAFTRMGLVQA